jgi:predicted transcriptional regulator
MTTLTIPISEEASRRLQEIANQEGVSSEELARAGLEDWLTRPRPDFLEAAKYVLEKNRELYRRLA